jgi:GNAT superfamily N-acetyltransferase
MTTHTWKKGELAVSTDPARLDLSVIHGFLSKSYWAEGIAVERVARSIAGSLPFGVYDGNTQVGLARVITDRATFAYLADVFIVESYRGRGLSKWLLECILTHPELQGLRRFLLATRDAHGLYRKAGFTPLGDPERFMVIQGKPYKSS